MRRIVAAYESELASKYGARIQNKWFWIIFALVILVGVFAYAFYCTNRGYNFAGNVRVGWPKLWEMGIGCRR